MTLPDFSFEKSLYRRNCRLIAGVDEVGRGCFAGPVVAAAVVFNPDGVLPLDSPTAFPPGNNRGAPSMGLPISRHPLVFINDSKQLSKKQREIADVWIRKNAVAFGVGMASVAEINRLGIKKSTEKAFRRAIVNCKLQIDYLLIDAFYIPNVRGIGRKKQSAIVKGDTKSISIAAASIIAKVHRDKLMTTLSVRSEFEMYAWHKNKGYGTKEHCECIRKYGITKLHRRDFVNTWIKNSKHETRNPKQISNLNVPNFKH